ncbi:VRR-NUC domain-containing protein [Sphingomicrobium sp. XHP0235]|uniref:VRR-NUC domain-containing protein n=1 Tax=Sphingomicrobium aquimarinum TaxID=3133971 RepID=UPI0031FEAAB7
MNERQVQRSIIAAIRLTMPDVLYHHSPNGAHLSGSVTARCKQIGALKGDGMKPGWPDLVCHWRGGFAYLEVKRPKGGKVSETQAEVHEQLRDLDCPIAVVTSSDEALTFLKECGAPFREAA